MKKLIWLTLCFAGLALGWAVGAEHEREERRRREREEQGRLERMLRVRGYVEYTRPIYSPDGSKLIGFY